MATRGVGRLAPAVLLALFRDADTLMRLATPPLAVDSATRPHRVPADGHRASPIRRPTTWRAARHIGRLSKMGEEAMDALGVRHERDQPHACPFQGVVGIRSTRLSTGSRCTWQRASVPSTWRVERRFFVTFSARRSCRTGSETRSRGMAIGERHPRAPPGRMPRVR